MNDETLILVKKAQEGSPIAIEKLINEQKPFIQKTTSQICKRSVNWDNDDELSIALMAFYEAIEKYKPDKGAHFLTFARRVINQRLIDFFRRENRHQHLPLISSIDEEEKDIGQFETDKAVEEYQKRNEQEELAATIIEFQKRLMMFDITLEDLVNASPKHRDTREKLLNVTLTLCENNELLDSMKKTKRIPSRDLAKIAKVSRRVLEKGRKYIIALAIIISESQFSNLKYFAGIEEI